MEIGIWPTGVDNFSSPIEHNKYRKVLQDMEVKRTTSTIRRSASKFGLLMPLMLNVS